jgi:hypothetical protein
MRFAIRISKGITLSLLLSYSVVKEPTSAKGRQSCQTLTAVSSGLVSLLMKPTRLTRTRLPLEFTAGKDPRKRCCVYRLQEPGIVSAPRCIVNYRKYRFTTPWRISLFHSAKIASGLARHCCGAPFRLAQTAVQIRVIVRFPKIRYRSGTSQNDSRWGPIPRFSPSPASLA